MGIAIKKSIQLETKIQITDEREADFILKIDPHVGKAFILHLEFQSVNDPHMLERMHRYLVYIRQEYKLPVKQYVVYFGHRPLKMTKELIEENIHYRYDIINMKDIPCEKFLDSEKPEEIILAILCDFKGRRSQDLVRAIIEHLKERTEGELLFSKYIRQLEILSQLRDLQKIVFEEENKMSIIFDIKKDLRYQQGLEEGMEKGEEKGKAEGLSEGMGKEKEKTARAMLLEGLDINIIKKVTGLSEEEIEKLRGQN